MVRNALGSVLALAGATAAVWSPFRAWYDGRHGSAYRIDDLFSGISADKAAVAGSMLLPFAFAALVTLVALVLRSRALLVVAGLVVLGFTILWMVRQGQAAGHLTVESSGNGLGQGVGIALGGGLLLLIAAALMPPRRRVGPESSGRVDVAGVDTRTPYEPSPERHPYGAPGAGGHEPPAEDLHEPPARHPHEPEPGHPRHEPETGHPREPEPSPGRPQHEPEPEAGSANPHHGPEPRHPYAGPPPVNPYRQPGQGGPQPPPPRD
ncbi:hypothetical protein DWB77_04399 [Streptomyces hundungensis]|uniref:IgA FC receptor n=1 Tax=Streptomyces hundungensis TaxID=1077946 RepID=A0A387HFG8_9ACTN|nr:hypothetical protein [Streptomyces hundungensis]AYG82229.1 hypothetical protein DWB77_04399 [Streptomyces hundungensis]